MSKTTTTLTDDTKIDGGWNRFILGEGSGENEISLIYELLDSPYKSVVYRAKEAIYELEPKI